ncbi:unnamed protein product [Rodentolepis nana]|uniref:C2H2-type domain-containing protein n=1 Tax=Rodentolepis nana TaxID=102285 RepID=A0A3P7T6U0_RODNA|nr:unnamed protein product [Rodentolepis nana]
MTNSAINYFSCPICNFRSKDRNEIRIHFQAVHKHKMDSNTSLAKQLKAINRTSKEPAIYILFVFLAPLNNSNSIVDDNDLTKHDPLDEFVESIDKMITKTTNKEKRLPCDTCKETFSYKGYFVAHKCKRKGVKSFKCESCGKSYFTKSELNSHKRVHSDEKPYECKKCGNKFKRQSDLTHHMSTHSKKRPFECGECKQHLIYHMRSRHGVIGEPKMKYICIITSFSVLQRL